MYLAVVIDLYSRRVIGWSLRSRQTTDVVLQALLMAVWRRKPRNRVLIHSDQGSQFSSIEVARFVLTDPGRSISGSLPFGLCRNRDWLQRVEVGLIRRLPVKR